jgi:hypothetical protein
MGYSWKPQGEPGSHPHEYERGGTAKLLTLFHPKTGKVIVKGVTSTPNKILHPWMMESLTSVLNKILIENSNLLEANNHTEWHFWQEGLKEKITLPEKLPKLKILLILDNLKGHKTPEFVLWLFKNGIMPLYTPLGGSWLNMAESIQNILVSRAVKGQHPKSSNEIIEWLEDVAGNWNESPTPFEWGGKRHERRLRNKERRRNLRGSGARAKKQSI